MKRGSVPVDHQGWEGWFFEDGYLCSPNNDRFDPLVVMACFFYRQMSQVSSLWKAEIVRDDSLLELVMDDRSSDGRWLTANRPAARRELAIWQPPALPIACAPAMSVGPH